MIYDEHGPCAPGDGDSVQRFPAAQPGGVPEGWKLVPEDPTQSMRGAGNRCLDMLKTEPGMTIADRAFYAWGAMIAATPQPAQQVTRGQIMAACDQVDKLQQAYLDGYELDDGEHQPHSPSEFESLLIHDAVCGLLSDDEFVAAFVRWRNLVDGAQQVDGKGGSHE